MIEFFLGLFIGLCLKASNACEEGSHRSSFWLNFLDGYRRGMERRLFKEKQQIERIKQASPMEQIAWLKKGIYVLDSPGEK